MNTLASANPHDHPNFILVFVVGKDTKEAVTLNRKQALIMMEYLGYLKLQLEFEKLNSKKKEKQVLPEIRIDLTPIPGLTPYDLRTYLNAIADIHLGLEHMRKLMTEEKNAILFDPEREGDDMPEEYGDIDAHIAKLRAQRIHSGLPFDPIEMSRPQFERSLLQFYSAMTHLTSYLDSPKVVYDNKIGGHNLQPHPFVQRKYTHYRASDDQKRDYTLFISDMKKHEEKAGWDLGDPENINTPELIDLAISTLQEYARGRNSETIFQLLREVPQFSSMLFDTAKFGGWLEDLISMLNIPNKKRNRFRKEGFGALAFYDHVKTVVHRPKEDATLQCLCDCRDKVYAEFYINSEHATIIENMIRERRKDLQSGRAKVDSVHSKYTAEQVMKKLDHTMSANPAKDGRNEKLHSTLSATGSYRSVERAAYANEHDHPHSKFISNHGGGEVSLLDLLA